MSQAQGSASTSPNTNYYPSNTNTQTSNTMNQPTYNQQPGVYNQQPNYQPNYQQPNYYGGNPYQSNTNKKNNNDDWKTVGIVSAVMSFVLLCGAVAVVSVFFCMK